MIANKLSTSTVITLLVLINIGLSQAMLPPPMLRAVCGAFADAEEVVGNKALAAGKAAVDLAMKPIAIVGGLKAAAVGTGMKVGGGAIKFVGEKMAKDGALLEATGAGVKGAGLGVAALGVKPLAEKVVAAGNVAEGSINAAGAAAENMFKSIGDTSIQIDATVDSPIVGHHHKEVNLTTGMNTAFHQAHLTQQTEQQQTKAKRAAPSIDPDVMKSALNLVKEANMTDCVYRAICDLQCDPQGFGPDGKQVFLNMMRLQGTKIVEPEEMKKFQQAANKGRSGGSGKCDACTTYHCKSKSSDLIKMASHIKMD